jgi:diguanylate cyclase (GGDEF)-like protein/PAS domain S-box-containing protein
MADVIVELSSHDAERLCMRNLLASSDERVFFKDLQSRLLLVSEGFVAELGQGRSAPELIGCTDFDLFTAHHASEAAADEFEIMRTGKPLIGKVEVETFHDSPNRWVSTSKWPLRSDAGQIIGTFGISRDVTDQIEAQQQLAWQALHDPLTGVANRLALIDRLTQALLALERRGGTIALLFVDLDGFKEINDTLGHDVGDQVLTEVAQRLQSIARREDTVARFGGDEFVLLSTGLGKDADCRLIGDRAIRALRAPLATTTDVKLSGSVGIVATSDPAADPGTLLQQADFAMYLAKRGGRDRFELYDPAVHELAASSQGLLSELPAAIADGQLFLLYQPLFRIDDGTLVGVEALVRWQHPERGVLAPAAFIPLAEQHSQIRLIDEFVLDAACRQFALWADVDPSWSERSISVNLSGSQLHDPDLAEHVFAVLERHDIVPSCLCLEITETALIGEPEIAKRTIETLSAHGVQVALDDFGTGYSTLAHLQQLKAQILKIDRSFIARLGEQPRDREIIAAITAMAHALGMTVISEGIETRVQHDQVAAIGCDQGQGYLLAPPLHATEIATVVAASAARSTRAA